MKVIGVLSRKGGVGKTTLAIHLAVLAQQAGLRALLVDLDPQGSAAAWWRAREAETPLLVETAPAELRGILDAAEADGVDLVMVDARPSVEADAVRRDAGRPGADPETQASDLRPTRHPWHAGYREGHRSPIVLNACPPPRGAGEASIVTDARRALAAFGVPVAPVAIINRAAFAAAAVSGLTAIELEPVSKAAKEMRALWRVVEKELSHEKTHARKRASEEGATRAKARSVAS